ncbi:protein of unknown function DUF111 [Ignisphaera aggregans DSM 17230]|uniref:Putative nickel insertion protein n=1 Tax=Ignisphaera aggregans (strain DSM 17230 / JCM 13409 / AQ1.S1) TaxID=583356 RepID=E0SS47_IGNAA|nr:protein of unknown function DUF111 [Ignisphaera aggregans DSM 17230]
MTILVFDPSIAGVSGDMILGSLVDLGANQREIELLREFIPRYVDGVSDIDISFIDVHRGGFRAKKLVAKFIDRASHRHGIEMIRAVERIVMDLELSDKMKSFAINAIKSLVEVEAYVHGVSIDSVELDESGSIDTIIDIVGTAIALQSLGIADSTVLSLPIALGGGKISFSHGIFSVPTPATLELAKRGRALVFGGPIDEELATPTGVAILINLVDRFEARLPPVKPIRIGYGAGDKEFKSIPNILRAILCENTNEVDGYSLEEIGVIETDIDDATGEMAGYIVERLLNSGARDVSIIPLYMKKNRPGFMIRAITDIDNMTKLADILIREIGTLGVRYNIYKRVVVPIRELRPIEIEINGRKATITLKIGRNLRGEIISVKPEYEDLKTISKEFGIPIKDVLRIIYENIGRYINYRH